MNKTSYENKRKKRVKSLKNLTLKTPDESVGNNPTSGITSNFHPHPLMKEEELENLDGDSKKILEILNSEYESQIGKDSYYDCINILIKNSSNKNYFQEIKDLISSIIDSSPLFYQEDLDSLLSIYHSSYKNAIRNKYDNPEKYAYLDTYSAYKNSLKKIAQYVENDPVYVAKQIVNIIDIMINRMKPESRSKSYINLREKLSKVNPAELAGKKSPGGAAIGISISLVKNMLIARDPFFINVVLDEVLKRLIR